MLKLAYQLRYHYLGSRSWEGWLTTLVVLAAVVLALLRLPTFLAGSDLWLWLPVALLLFLALLFWLYGRWAAGQSYVSFEPETGLSGPDGCALLPTDKVLIRATGWFEVEGKRHFFAHLLAYWRTFGSREHTVMAIVHKTTFLGGQMPDDDTGMWYIFFCPDKILRIAPGRLTYGDEQRPALRLVYQPPRPPAGPPRRPTGRPRQRPLPRPETVYLSFDDEASRLRIWADLLADAAGA